MCHKFMAHPLFSFLRSFFSSDFTDESEAFLLIGLLTDFRGYLASGQWLAPEIFPYCFCHADFANDADFSSWKFFCPTDFADIHRFSSSWFFFIGFHGWIGGILAYRITHGISQNFGRWPMAGARYMLLLFFVPQISQIYTDFLWNLWWISLSVSGGICNDRTGRLRENPWVIALAGNLRINSVSSDE